MNVEGLTGLNILVVSPNNWGDMRVSKHHYAAALAQRGNRVYFLNPPDAHAAQRIRIADVDDVEGLWTITYRPLVPFWIRFRSRALFDLVAAAHVRWLVKHIGCELDIVWCFDANLYSDLRWFGAPLKIFHPVDQISLAYQEETAKHADLVLSVSEQILLRTWSYGKPQLRVEHGLAPEFVAMAEQRLREPHYQRRGRPKVGYVGNLLTPYIDRHLMLELIRNHDEVEFNFWGPRSRDESNVGADDTDGASAFVEALCAMRNVTLHGTLPPAALPSQVGAMDVLFMCYSVSRDPNQGCNSHKILEYLSTGRVVVANHVSDYADKNGLIEMLETRADDPAAMAMLLDEVLSKLDCYNNREHRVRRLTYALANTYANQIDRIAHFAETALSRATPRPAGM